MTPRPVFSTPPNLPILPNRASIRRLMLLLLISGAVLTSVVTVLGLAGAWHFRLDLLTHFRMQYLVIHLLVLPFLWCQGWKKIVGIGLVGFAINAWLVGSLFVPYPSTSSPSTARELRVLSLNVWVNHKNNSLIEEQIRQCGADVVGLYEIGEPWRPMLSRLGDIYPHQQVHAEGTWGIAVISRYPMHEPQWIDLSANDLISFTATLFADDHPIRFLAMHPFPPNNAQGASVRDAELAAAAQWVNQAPETPSWIMGDFNATPWSAPYRQVLRLAPLRNAGQGHGCLPTWAARTPFAIPIDHILISSTVLAQEFTVLPRVGSDHSGVMARLGW